MAAKPPPKPKSMMAASAKPKPAAKPASAERRQGSMSRPAERRQVVAPVRAAKAGEAARGGTARAGASSRAGEAARGGSANSNTSKAYSSYRQNALDYMAKVPGGTAKYAGELQRLQKEGSYDKRYGQSANQRAAGTTAARKVNAAKNPAEKKAANRSRGESL